MTRRPTPLRTRVFLNLVPLVLILAGFGAFSYFLFTGFSRQVGQHVETSQRIDVVADQIGIKLARLQGLLTLSQDVAALDPSTRSKIGGYMNEINSGVERLVTLTTNAANSDLIEQITETHSDLLAIVNAVTRESNGSVPPQAEWLPIITAMDRSLEELGVSSRTGMPVLKESFEVLQHRVVAALIAGILVAVGVAALCCYFLARAILQPIHEMTDATWAIAEGRLDHRINVRSADELGKLGRAFNRMADRLEAFRRTQDESVVRTHQFMEATMASFPDPVFIFDRNGEEELRNASAKEWLKAVGSTDEIPPEIDSIRKRVFEQEEDVLPKDFAEALTWRIRGRKMFYLPRALLIQQNSVISGVALVLHDVTRFRLMDEVKSSLIGTVSHEIKTPLTSVSMVLHLLEEESLGKLNSEQRELVLTALQDTERLLSVIRDLLDLSRLEAGRIPLELVETTAESIAANATEPLLPQLEDRNQKLQTNFQDGLSKLKVDAQRIGYVVRNLVENASKYSPEGTTIELAIFSDNDSSVQIAIRDEGPGIPEKFHDRIFEKFFRMPGSTASGTGLGLSICREIVIAHGGRLEICNRKNGGAEFIVTLPVLNRHD